jgi:hypothetical protein
MSSGGMWIALTIVLGVVAYALFLVAVPSIATSGKVKVERHFERSLNYLPRADDIDGAVERLQPPPLREFAKSREAEAEKYVFPVLFPLDFVMMIFMTAFLVVGCVTFGSYVPWAANRTGLLIALPVLYFVFDLAEDTLLAWLLKHPDAISFERVDYLKLLTAGKLMTFAAAHLELAVLVVVAGWSWLRSA